MIGRLVVPIVAGLIVLLAPSAVLADNCTGLGDCLATAGDGSVMLGLLAGSLGVLYALGLSQARSRGSIEGGWEGGNTGADLGEARGYQHGPDHVVTSISYDQHPDGTWRMNVSYRDGSRTETKLDANGAFAGENRYDPRGVLTAIDPSGIAVFHDIPPTWPPDVLVPAQPPTPWQVPRLDAPPPGMDVQRNRDGSYYGEVRYGNGNTSIVNWDSSGKFEFEIRIDHQYGLGTVIEPDGTSHST